MPVRRFRKSTMTAVPSPAFDSPRTTSDTSAVKTRSSRARPAGDEQSRRARRRTSLQLGLAAQMDILQAHADGQSGSVTPHTIADDPFKIRRNQQRRTSLQNALEEQLEILTEPEDRQSVPHLSQQKSPLALDPELLAQVELEGLEQFASPIAAVPLTPHPSRSSADTKATMDDGGWQGQHEEERQRSVRHKREPHRRVRVKDCHLDKIASTAQGHGLILSVEEEKKIAWEQTLQKSLEVMRNKPPHTRDPSDVEILMAITPQVRVLQGFEHGELAGLCQAMQYQDFEAHKTVVRVGDEGGRMFVILKGSCGVHILKKRTPAAAAAAVDEGVEPPLIHVCDLMHGAHFGELTLFSGVDKRTATIVTREPTTLLSLARADFDDVLQNRIERKLATKVVALAPCPLFVGISVMALIKLGYQAHLRTLGHGEILQAQGEVCLKMHIILNGEVTVHQRTNVNHKSIDVLVGTLGKGMILGTTGAISNGKKKCRFTVVARTNLQLVTFNCNGIARILDTLPLEILTTYHKSFVTNEEVIRSVQAKNEWAQYRRSVVQQSRSSHTKPLFGRRACSNARTPRSPRNEKSCASMRTDTSIASGLSLSNSSREYHCYGAHSARSSDSKARLATSGWLSARKSTAGFGANSLVKTASNLGGNFDRTLSAKSSSYGKIAMLHERLDDLISRREKQKAQEAKEHSRGHWRGRALMRFLEDSTWDPMVRDASAEIQKPQQEAQISTSESQLLPNGTPTSNIDVSSHVNRGNGIVLNFYAEAACNVSVINMMLRPSSGVHPLSAPWLVFLGKVHEALDSCVKNACHGMIGFHRVRNTVYDYFIIGGVGDSLPFQAAHIDEQAVEAGPMPTHRDLMIETAKLALQLQEVAQGVYQAQEVHCKEQEGKGDTMKKTHNDSTLHIGIACGDVQYCIAGGAVSIPYQLSGSAADVAKGLALASITGATLSDSPTNPENVAPMMRSLVWFERKTLQILGGKFESIPMRTSSRTMMMPANSDTQETQLVNLFPDTVLYQLTGLSKYEIRGKCF